MHIDHIGIWTNDLERLKDFYIRFFNCKVSDRYDNPMKQFSSYFLSFTHGARIEIMQSSESLIKPDYKSAGPAHFAIGVGTNAHVDTLTLKMKNAGITVESYPRKTGDGYYESVILDPENNKVELVAIDDYKITAANPDDLPMILYLQKCCYLSEAEIYRDFSIAPLTQTIEDIMKDFNNQTFLKLELNGRIIGSVRAYSKDNTCYIGRLIVDRNYQNMGLGGTLLESVEASFRQVHRFELFTGFKSDKNLYLYKKLGYKPFKQEKVNDDFAMIYLEKLK